MSVWDGLAGQLADLAARDQHRYGLGPRLRSWFDELAERHDLPEVTIELDSTLYDRCRWGEFEALRSGELVIRIYPYADDEQTRSTLEHEVAHLVRYRDPDLTANCHDAAFDRALRRVRGESVPAPRRAARSATGRRPVTSSSVRSSARSGDRVWSSPGTCVALSATQIAGSGDRVRSVAEARRQGFGPGHRNWAGHGAAHCVALGVACDRHAGVTAAEVRRVEERGTVRVSGGRAAVEA